MTKKFLEEHPEEIGVSVDTPIGIGTISNFLGWNESRVQFSLERLRLIDLPAVEKKEAASKRETASTHETRENGQQTYI